MIESFHYRERGRTRLLETPGVPDEVKKYCFESGKSVYNFLQIEDIKHLIGLSERAGVVLLKFGATVPDRSRI